MLEYDLLDGVAIRIAATVSGHEERADMYQEAWVRFLRYRPRNRTGAYRMAISARNDLYRRQVRY